MPAHFGPLANPDRAESKPTSGAGTLYGDVSQIFLTYLTDAQMLSRFLPDRYELSGEPLVTINYSRSRSIDWRAGGSYNIVGVFAPAVFHGKTGSRFGIVCNGALGESHRPDSDGPGSAGRPKIYGDIEGHQVSGDSLAHLARPERSQDPRPARIRNEANASARMPTRQAQVPTPHRT